MISYQKLKHVVGDKLLVEAVCLSTDTKPTENIADSSKLTEQNTGKKYLFNGGTWYNVTDELPIEIEEPTGESGIIVEEKTFSSNGTYVAPEGHAYSPVTVQIKHPEDLIEGIKRTIKEDIPKFKSEYLKPMSDEVVKKFDDLITNQFIRVLFYLTGE